MKILSDFYGLSYGIKSFAVANDFVVNTNKACYALGKQLQPFCIYGGETQKQFGTLDFADFTGFLNPEANLVDEIAEYRANVYSGSHFPIDLSSDLQKRMLFFDYLMTISICYVEIPKYVTKEGMPMATYDKFLCTRNPSIMATWMGASVSEMQAKYSSRIQLNGVDFSDCQLKLVKLNHTSKGNSVTVPRSIYSVKKMVCIPMYMMYAFVEGAKTLMMDNIVEFSFLKDNGTVRVLPTTLSEDILRQYYSNNNYIAIMLAGVDINTVQQGGLILSSKMNRGYIKVPEVGASIYDGTGVRSLNLARLLSARIVQEVDRSFINVDLNSVIANFADCLDYLIKLDISQIKPCYELVTGETSDEQPAVLVAKMKEYAESRSVLLSTTFHRSLHMFMVEHPEWFPRYTGTPNNNITSSANYGVEAMDF